MSDEVQRFPTVGSTERVIEMSLANAATRQVAAMVGDLVAYCVEADTDCWAIAPVAAVDSFGTVMGVALSGGQVISLWGHAELQAFFVMSAEEFRIEDMAKLCWLKFWGALALREAVRPYRTAAA